MCWCAGAGAGAGAGCKVRGARCVHSRLYKVPAHMPGLHFITTAKKASCFGLQLFILDMAFGRHSSLLVLLVLHNIFGGLAATLPPAPLLTHNNGNRYGFEDLQSLWQAYKMESVDCEKFPDSPGCAVRDPAKPRGYNECTYTVTLRSKIFPNEVLAMCARPRQSLPCRLNGNVACEVPPMEVSHFDLMILHIINIELQVRIMQLKSQGDLSRDLSLDLQREIELIISDNAAWLCSRKCDNSSCEFNAELQTHMRTIGGIPRMASLVTDYPYVLRTTRLQRIQIDLPLGSLAISRLLKKAPFTHLAVSSLPLTVSCLKN